ncbi:hypothetical protein RFI_07484 [Reticulomyxa filosa]|uniref:Uncharacterized protein n=1 Tax=Reticulomyxa filosa TaxID=46433 RepID=X6NUC5_RETFI|nr:hypothetical protein RFI_07484 [Reticulomyxa filosa]|eukprot:ETO29636.1 hypothetical protein RFI_07484 [Reticulomyxa filosa]
MKLSLDTINAQNQKLWAYALGIVPLYWLGYGVFNTLQWVVLTCANGAPWFRGRQAQLSKAKMRRWLRELHSIVVKHIGKTTISSHDCGVFLQIVREMSASGVENAKTKLITDEENKWLQFDLNHLVSQQFTVQQSTAWIQRLERYYL